jgi:hypothetical protein
MVHQSLFALRAGVLAGRRPGAEPLTLAGTESGNLKIFKTRAARPYPSGLFYVIYSRETLIGVFQVIHDALFAGIYAGEANEMIAWG